MIFPPLAKLKKMYELSLSGDIFELEEYIDILAKSDANLDPLLPKYKSFLKNINLRN
ncbi:hypothetical protein QUF74_03280 [Candidatus Halobeggiatoa sp. HSG11]|nr:hypothetical protein [Candidatus Halobeggiatoa sp. HSG11]